MANIKDVDKIKEDFKDSIDRLEELFNDALYIQWKSNALLTKYTLYKRGKAKNYLFSWYTNEAEIIKRHEDKIAAGKRILAKIDSQIKKELKYLADASRLSTTGRLVPDEYEVEFSNKKTNE